MQSENTRICTGEPKTAYRKMVDLQKLEEEAGGGVEMHNYYPILWGRRDHRRDFHPAIVAAFVVKDGEKETGFERNMKDSEIMQRLMD